MVPWFRSEGRSRGSGPRGSGPRVVRGSPWFRSAWFRSEGRSWFPVVPVGSFAFAWFRSEGRSRERNNGSGSRTSSGPGATFQCCAAIPPESTSSELRGSGPRVVRGSPWFRSEGRSRERNNGSGSRTSSGPGATFQCCAAIPPESTSSELTAGSEERGRGLAMLQARGRGPRFSFDGKAPATRRRDPRAGRGSLARRRRRPRRRLCRTYASSRCQREIRCSPTRPCDPGRHPGTSR